MNRVIKFYESAPVEYQTDNERTIAELTDKLTAEKEARRLDDEHHWRAIKTLVAAVFGAGVLGWTVGTYWK